MKIRNWLVVTSLAITTVSSAIAQAQGGAIEYEQQPLPPLPNSISGNETVDDRMKAWLKREGLKQGEQNLSDGRVAIVSLGRGTIAAPPTDKNFVQYRINAYYKALVDAKAKCAEFQQTSISTELKFDMSMPSEQRAIEDAKQLEREGLAKEGAVQVARALNTDLKGKSMPAAVQTAGVYVEKILDNKVRQTLTQMGVDPNKPVSEQQLKPIIGSQSFKKIAAAMAAERCTGIKVLSSFEQNPSSSQGSVGVITIYTLMLHEVANAIVSGNYLLIPKGKPGIAVEKHIPSDKRALLATFGTQMVRDEKGNYVLLSFGQAQPASSSQMAKDLAYRTARLEAQTQIRLFLGALVHSHNQMAGGEEIIEREGEDPKAMMDMTTNSSIRAIAKDLLIRGFQEVESWETLHPANNGPVVGVVMQWKASSAEIAGAVRKLNTISAAIASQTQLQGLPDSPVNTGGRQNPGQAAPQVAPRTSNATSAEGGVRSRDF
jgi:hypothetical protein